MLERSDFQGEAGGGRRGRLTSLYTRHVRDVWRWLAALGVRAADLDDATQDVFLTAFQALDEFEGRSSARTWLFGIASNVAANRRRRAYLRREVAEEERDDAEDHGASPERAAAVQQARSILERALDALPEEQRAVFTLYELAGYNGQTIAELMGCPVQTIYWRLRVAREHVEKHCAPHRE